MSILQSLLLCSPHPQQPPDFTVPASSLAEGYSFGIRWTSDHLHMSIAEELCLSERKSWSSHKMVMGFKEI